MHYWDKLEIIKKYTCYITWISRRDATQKCIQISYTVKGLVVCDDGPLIPFTSLDRIAEEEVVIMIISPRWSET